MIDINDIREIAKNVHLSKKSQELKDNFHALYSKTIRSYQRLQCERISHLEACECALNSPKSRCEFDFTGYAKAYYEFLDNYNDLDYLVFQINNGK